MIVGVTGHRDVEAEPGELLAFARLSVAKMIERGATEIITGMARGWDLKIARAADDAGLPYTAAVPYPGQADRWSSTDRVDWHRAYTRASRRVEIGLMPLDLYFKVRNRWIVDNSHELWSLWSGRPGGTKHCVLYAEEVGLTIRPLWEPWLRFRAERN